MGTQEIRLKKRQQITFTVAEPSNVVITVLGGGRYSVMVTGIKEKSIPKPVVIPKGSKK